MLCKPFLLTDYLVSMFFKKSNGKLNSFASPTPNNSLEDS